MASKNEILDLDSYLQRGAKTIFYTYSIISCLGFCIDILNFQNASNGILFNNILIISITIGCFGLYMLKKLSLKISFGIILYASLVNVIIDTFTGLYSPLRIDFFLRDSLFLVIPLTLVALIIRRVHAIIFIGIYSVAAICFTIITQNAFLLSSIYVIVLFVTVYAMVIYHIVGVIEKSILERERNIQIINEKNEMMNETNTILEERQQQIEEQSEELSRQAEALKEQSYELAVKNSELAKSNNTKDLFLSILAHDLKNPFHAILGFSEILETRFNKLNDDKKVQYISIISSTTQKAYNLLENLLQWARAQSNTIEYNPKKVAVNALIKENLYFFLETYRNKKLGVTEKIDADCFANVDENMLNTIIRNLLSNAIKFTPSEGSINITCTEENGHIVVQIADTGVGIEEEDLKNLFRIDKIYSTPGTNGETGTGLGLVLCKDFIEMNGGTISVVSKKNIGTKFTFELPVFQ
jgi:signal transduction histidine kinase